MSRWPITAFADEISPVVAEQVEVLAELGLSGLDLRSAGGRNVTILTPTELDDVRRRCEDAGLKVSSIGSPTNKVPFDLSQHPVEMRKLEASIAAAQRVGTRFIRIFTPSLNDTFELGDLPKVIDWLAPQVELAEREDVVLLHENDARCWGASPLTAQRLFEKVGGPRFRAAYDFANGVPLGFPAPHWVPWIEPYLEVLHIKDARASGEILPAGEGEGEIEPTLRQLAERGWEGSLAMEPHLDQAGRFGGFSGPERFHAAVVALRTLLARLSA